MGLPDHARGDFEKIVARHLEATAARERIEANWDPQQAAALAGYFADGFNRHGVVMARKRGIKAMRARNALEGWTDVGPVTPHDVLEIGFWRISVERHFIFMMVDCVERYTGERPNHGEKWFPKLMAVCQLIDREIDPGTVQGALRSPRHGLAG